MSEPAGPAAAPLTPPPAGPAGLRPLYGGFFLFGSTLGVTTGLSTVSGISQTLLSSLFTFVGGVLLTYAGFQRHPGEKAVLDPARVGYGISALMLGILLGLYGGIYARLDPPVPKALKERLATATSPGSTSATGAGFILHAAASETCGRIRGRLLRHQYSEAPQCAGALGDLEALSGLACSAPGGSVSQP